MTYASDDSDWQQRVCEKADGRCVWPGCGSTWNAAGHHVFDRRYSSLRLVVENGVCLCGKHHQVMHKLGVDREKASKLLIGRKTYSALAALVQKR